MGVDDGQLVVPPAAQSRPHVHTRLAQMQPEDGQWVRQAIGKKNSMTTIRLIGRALAFIKDVSLNLVL